jgi:hypothetical protein
MAAVVVTAASGVVVGAVVVVAPAVRAGVLAPSSKPLPAAPAVVVSTVIESPSARDNLILLVLKNRRQMNYLGKQV